MSDVSSPHRRRRRSQPEKDQNGFTTGNIRNIGFCVILAFVFGIFGFHTIRRVIREVAPPPAKEMSEIAPETQPLTAAERAAMMASEAEALSASKVRWNQALDKLAEAEHAMEQRHIAKARAAVDSGLELAPNLTRLLLADARLNAYNQDFAAAKTSVDRILERNPLDQKAQLLLSRIYQTEGNPEAAATMAEWILELDPMNIEAHRIAADCLLLTDHPADAVAHLRKIIEMDPSDPKAENDLARALTRSKQYDKAIAMLEELIMNNSSVSLSYYNLAVCYAQQERPTDAVRTLERAASLFGDHFVKAWVRSSEFDAIREHAEFASLVRQSEHSQSESSTDQAGE